jgi:hypothetical protein
MAKATKPWHDVIELRDDIRSSELSQKEFAADLYDVMMGRNKSVYHDPSEFFALTYATTKLRELAKDVVLRLAGKSEKAVRQLQLTYGGGKTHALIALVHLVRTPDALPKLPAVDEFVTHIGQIPPQARIAALVFDRLDVETGMEVTSPTGLLRRFKLPWNALAWQLGGEEGLTVVGSETKERETPPATNVLEELLALPSKEGLATLVLLDEVLMWAHTAATLDKGWLRKIESFFQCLTQAAVRVKGCALVASLLASDPTKYDDVGKQVESILYDMFQRVADEGVQPVEPHDVAEVLRRRLFTPRSYTDRSQWKAQVVSALNGICELDDQTRKNRSQEEERYLASFPFHPDVTDVLFQKWSQLEGFQRTRGVLRTFASALRDAEKWGDPSPLVGLGVFLGAPTDDNLTDATRELATVARTEQYEGKRQDWQAILNGELRKAKEIQSELGNFGGREVEQAVLAAFLHSQPIGMRAQTRDLMVLLGQSQPDRIDLGKGLARWADASWYLDEAYTGERDGALPRVWRLGSKPNLRQMHHDARLHVSSTVVEEVLEKTISDTKRLTDGARVLGALVHMLPGRPSDVEDDGLFHYVVLGPKAASESGKPSPEARRFIDETTGPDRPRARNRNAVILAVPAKEGIEVARERVRDYLAWEQVREMLRSRDDIDAIKLAQLATNVSAARGELGSHVVLAYCIVVTVNEANEVAAFRLNVDNDPLFPKIVGDKRSRIEETAINAEALLPGGPFDLWRPGEKSRFIKDLVGAFASNSRLPKMLNRGAILDTFVRGCEAGDFVLQVSRADKSLRTFWKAAPDDAALIDPSLEVVLSDGARLTELDSKLLLKGALPELWKGEALALGSIARYFSGTHYVQLDKGGYYEPFFVPHAELLTTNAAVMDAVRSGKLWLINGPVSILGEDVPEGFLTEQAELLVPPPVVPVADLLPDSLPSLWSAGDCTAHQLHTALSIKLGRTLPWTTVRSAIDDAFRVGLLERTVDSKDWPTDLGGASSVKLRAIQSKAPAPRMSEPIGAKVATSELAVSEVQDLADQVDAIRAAAAGQKLTFQVTIKVGDGEPPPDSVVEALNGILSSIKGDWYLG